MDKIEIMKQCKNFGTCNCNNCPLDNDSSFRTNFGYEGKCNLAKKARMKIAKKYGLTSGGLKRSEKSAKARFERMDEKEKKKFIAGGSQRLSSGA